MGTVSLQVSFELAPRRDATPDLPYIQANKAVIINRLNFQVIEVKSNLDTVIS